MSRRIVCGLCWVFVCFPAVVSAQGVLVVTDPHQQVRLPRPIVGPRPVPEASYTIKAIDVHARLTDQVARVQVAQTFQNTGSTTLEVSFVFPLPYDGAIDQLTLEVDGKEIPAELLAADDARRRYEAIVAKNRDPALLEWVGNGMFQTSVFPVPAGQERKVTLKYAQLCRKHKAAVDFLFPMSTAKYTSKPIETVSIRTTIESGGEIRNVYSPTHDVKIERPDAQHAVVTYHKEGAIPANDLRLFFDTAAEGLQTTVLSYRPDEEDDGYFLLMASPDIEDAKQDPVTKSVVFVVDRSGSMSGKKIEQAKGALRFVVNQLNEGDLFNIVAYDTVVESFRPELQRFDDTTRSEALGFIEGIYAGGSTNIDAALTTAMGQLVDEQMPNYVVFLTDGLPTAGEVNEGQIVSRSESANGARARLFAFGVGYDVNSRLLDRLARANFGVTEYVRPDEDIEGHVSRLYQRIGAPVMTNVELAFALDGVTVEGGEPINRRYPKDAFDLFTGDQLVLVGRYRSAGSGKVTVTGQVGDESQSFAFDIELAEKSNDGTYAFVERLWAIRRVGEIIDEIDLNGRNEELVAELVALSKKHGILTQYTSFLADETTRLEDDLALNASAGERLEELESIEGESGFHQRRLKGMFQNAQNAALPAEANYAFDAAAPSRQPTSAAAPGSVIVGLNSRAGAAFDGEASRPAVRNVAGRSFFRRNEQWIDSTVSEEQQRNAVRVVQFSPEYFELAATGGQRIASLLAQDETMVFNYSGSTYLVEPPTGN